jgi:hypothetical protein
MRSIPESDWQKLRAMKDDMLNIACERIFKKLEEIMDKREGKEHEAYLQLWKLLEQEDHEISIMFDDLKRSNAIHKLAAWKYSRVISEVCFAEFSDETQQTVKALNETLR